ncbi:ATP-dependent DNA helicase tlh2 [Ceratobasidium sp. AG-Ba]|nr:ATP-dependent DNA helicase tlh2 [Ceratobasidium sp. AG-Ba]
MESRKRVTGHSTLKGTVSNKHLRPLSLAVIEGEHPILCCTECKKSPCTILQYDKCAEHVRKHFKQTNNCDSDDDDVGNEDEETISIAFLKKKITIPSATSINRTLAMYELWTPPLWEIPVPTEVISPFFFLVTHDAFKCLPCGSVLTIKRSDTTMRAHLIQIHGSSEDFDNKIQRVTVQSYSEIKNYRKDFIVDPSLKQAEDHRDEVGPADDPVLLAQAWRAQTATAAAIRAPKVVNLKTAPPFVVRSGWGDWTNKLTNVAAARALAHEPYEDNERILFDKALDIFGEDHVLLSTVAYIFRLRITMSEGDTESKALECKLEPKTVFRYGGCWASLMVFVVRIRRLQKEKTPVVPVIFTARQEKFIDSVDAALKKPKPRWRQLLYGLSRFLWADPGFFEHTTMDQFADATTAFSVLYCMREDLTFGRSNDITHDLNALRFAMQQVHLFWAIKFQKDAVDKSVLQETLKKDLDKTRHEGMPNFLYLGRGDNATATLGSKSISIKLWREGVQQMLRTFEGFLLKNLLLEVDPSELGLDFGPERKIEDNFSRRDPEYSFLKDDRNCFKEWKYRLASRMFANPRAAGMFERERDAGGNVVLKEAGVDRWLSDYSYAIRVTDIFAVLLHLVSGQPSRGAEFVLVRLMNDGWRVRNVYAMSNGRLAIVLFYTKTSSMTGKDRVVAYCVPWRITRLFLIIYGLVHPFVEQLLGMLLEGEAAEDAVRTHRVYMFSLRGQLHTSAQLSEDLKTFYASATGAELGVRDNRHFMIGVMRHETPLSKGPAERALALIDLQAGHGSAIAGMYYAVELTAAYELTNEQLAGFFVCSLVWYSFVMGGDPNGLTADDLLEIQRANLPGGHPSITGQVQPASTQLNPITDEQIDLIIKQALAQQQAAIRADTELVMQEKLVAFEARLAAAEKKYSPPPAPVVTFEHKRMLWRCVGSSDAEWTSNAQSFAFARICSLQASVLVVLPTGGGKSVLFIGPALEETGLTIVICPFLSLIANHVQSATAAGVQPYIYDPETAHTIGNGVVFVIIEKAVSAPFRIWVRQLIADRRIIRIIFDEAHEALLAKSYRENVTELCYLCSLGVPLVLMTA